MQENENYQNQLESYNKELEDFDEKQEKLQKALSDLDSLKLKK